MRGFGRQCRGQGKVFVKLVRQTEKQLLEVGHAITQLASDAQELLDQATQVSPAQCERLARDFLAHPERVDIRRVEEVDARFNRIPEKRHRIRLV